MKEVLLYIWQLPQNLIGLIMRMFCPADIGKDTPFRNDINVYISSKMSGGISLGKYIILSKYYSNYIISSNTWNHEYGHTRQSKYLGPLYLFIIGIPSLIWAGLYGTAIRETKNGYYKFYTERWADKLGRVER